MNKRGEESSTTGTLVVIIIGLIVLGLVVAGFYMGWDWVFGKFNLLPKDLTSFSAACKIYADKDIKLGFCQFTEGGIDGRMRWANCPYIYDIAEKTLGKGKVEFAKIDPCTGTDINFCVELKTKDGEKFNPDKVYVNAKTCTELGVTKSSTP